MARQPRKASSKLNNQSQPPQLLTRAVLEVQDIHILREYADSQNVSETMLKPQILDVLFPTRAATIGLLPSHTIVTDSSGHVTVVVGDSSTSSELNRNPQTLRPSPRFAKAPIASQTKGESPSQSTSNPGRLLCSHGTRIVTNSTEGILDGVDSENATATVDDGPMSRSRTQSYPPEETTAENMDGQVAPGGKLGSLKRGDFPIEHFPSPPPDDYSPPPQHSPSSDQDPHTPSSPASLRGRSKNAPEPDEPTRPDTPVSPGTHPTPPLHSPVYPPQSPLSLADPSWLLEMLVSLERRRSNLLGELEDAKCEVREAVEEVSKAKMDVIKDVGKHGLKLLEDELCQRMEELESGNQGRVNQGTGVDDEEKPKAEGAMVDLLRWLETVVGTEMVQKIVYEARNTAASDDEHNVTSDEGRNEDEEDNSDQEDDMGNDAIRVKRSTDTSCLARRSHSGSEVAEDPESQDQQGAKDGVEQDQVSQTTDTGQVDSSSNTDLQQGYTRKRTTKDKMSVQTGDSGNIEINRYSGSPNSQTSIHRSPKRKRHVIDEEDSGDTADDEREGSYSQRSSPNVEPSLYPSGPSNASISASRIQRNIMLYPYPSPSASPISQWGRRPKHARYESPEAPRPDSSAILSTSVTSPFPSNTGESYPDSEQEVEECVSFVAPSSDENIPSGGDENERRDKGKRKFMEIPGTSTLKRKAYHAELNVGSEQKRVKMPRTTVIESIGFGSKDDARSSPSRACAPLLRCSHPPDEDRAINTDGDLSGAISFEEQVGEYYRQGVREALERLHAERPDIFALIEYLKAQANPPPPPDWRRFVGGWLPEEDEVGEVAEDGPASSSDPIDDVVQAAVDTALEICANDNVHPGEGSRSTTLSSLHQRSKPVPRESSFPHIPSWFDLDASFTDLATSSTRPSGFSAFGPAHVGPSRPTLLQRRIPLRKVTERLRGRDDGQCETWKYDEGPSWEARLQYEAELEDMWSSLDPDRPLPYDYRPPNTGVQA